MGNSFSALLTLFASKDITCPPLIWARKAGNTVVNYVANGLEKTARANWGTFRMTNGGLALALFALFCTPAYAANADDVRPADIPVEAFAALSDFASPKLSPNGEHMGFITTIQGRTVAFFQKRDGSEMLAAPPIEEADIVGFHWATDDRILLIYEFSLNQKQFTGISIDGRAWIKTMGLTGQSYKSVSPFHVAKKITVPVLLLSSIDDARVPFKQSEKMHRRLKKLGKNSTYIQIDDGGHGWDNKASRMAVLTATKKILAKHIGKQNTAGAQ